MSVRCKEAKKYTMVMFWKCDVDCRNEFEGLKRKTQKKALEKALQMAEDVLYGSEEESTKTEKTTRGRTTQIL